MLGSEVQGQGVGLSIRHGQRSGIVVVARQVVDRSFHGYLVLAAKVPSKMIGDRPDHDGAGIDVTFANISPVDEQLIMPGLRQAGRDHRDVQDAGVQGRKDQCQEYQDDDTGQKIDRPSEGSSFFLPMVFLEHPARRIVVTDSLADIGWSE